MPSEGRKCGQCGNVREDDAHTFGEAFLCVGCYAQAENDFCVALREINPDEIRCAYTYNGRNGGHLGQKCERPEEDHCLGVADCADEMHNPACKLFIAGDWDRFSEPPPRKRSMVHHPFHRGRRTA